MSVRAPSGERLVRVASGHWIVYVAPYSVAFLLIAVSVSALAFSLAAAANGLAIAVPAFWGGLGLLLFAQHWLFLYRLSDSLGHILVTDRRVIVLSAKLLVSETMREVSFEKMKTVAATKSGFLQNVLSYGTLTFEGGSEIPYVSHPNAVVRDIQQAMGMR